MTKRDAWIETHLGRAWPGRGVFGEQPSRHASGLLITMFALALLVAAAPPGHCISVVSWTSDTITLSCGSASEESAGKDCLAYCISPLILHADIRAQWSAEIADKIMSQPDQYVVRVRERDDHYLVELNSLQLMRDLVSTIFGDSTPRVAVLSVETLLRRPPVIDPAVETEANRQLLKCGFQVVDTDTVDQSQYREKIILAVGGDDEARQWVQTELKSDIILKGEGIAVETAAGGVEVRTEVKVVEVATGRVLAADAAPSALHTQTVEVAAKQALEAATSDAMPRAIVAMLNAFGKPIHHVKLSQVRAFSEATAIRAGLLKVLPGCKVNIVSVDATIKHLAVLDVTTKSSDADLAAALEQVDSPKIEVLEMLCRNILCKLH